MSPFKNLLQLGLCVSFFLSSSTYAIPQNSTCTPLLWPAKSLSNTQSELLNRYDYSLLQHAVNKLTIQSPSPVITIATAGQIDAKNTVLLSSRKALSDADRAALFSLMFALGNNRLYLDKAKDILLLWSATNKPTGNPVDENRLEGMLWAYDLISCQLTEMEKKQILSWFREMRDKKIHWKFGPVTSSNNHRTHHIKILLLLDKILNRQEDWQNDVSDAIKYSEINLDSSTGESLDYRQRSALYYHNYDLQSWIEIGLITGCCKSNIERAMSFLVDHIRSNDIGGEFSHSQAKIDSLREKGGFEYAKTNGIFDVHRAAPTIVSYYTLNHSIPPADLWQIVEDTKTSPWLSFIKTRRTVW